jgi:hypothetical protein
MPVKLFLQRSSPLLALLATACPPVPIDPGVVAGSTPSSDCNGCYLSQLDNPILTDQALLTPGSDEQGNLVFEGAAANTSGFEYDYFRMSFSASGDPTQGATTTSSLIPNPPTTGTWATSDNQDHVFMPWELHGIELGYSYTQAAAVHLDVANRPTQVPAIPVQVKLDPSVMLVPVQVIRVLPPPNSDLESRYNLRRYSQFSYKKLFDDWGNDPTYIASKSSISA